MNAAAELDGVIAARPPLRPARTQAVLMRRRRRRLPASSHPAAPLNQLRLIELSSRQRARAAAAAGARCARER
jgi:hypothetical protein